MDSGDRRIEILGPFGEACELMKKILFQPFDFKKWLVLGFAAFIGGASGRGFSFNWSNPARSTRQTFVWNNDLPSWFWPAMIVLGILVVIFIFVLLWVTARGRFVFADCIVRNRAAIVAPWKEYRREGNSFFLFSLCLALSSILLVGVALAIVLPMGTDRTWNPIAIVSLLCLALLWIFFVICSALVGQLMVPVMYRRRCLATIALHDVLRLISENLGVFAIYVFFSVGLFLAVVIVSVIATCATCCLAALPYVGAVVLLPVSVWLRSFVFYFLRQFGTDYDIWAALPAEPAPPLPPPLPGVA